MTTVDRTKNAGLLCVNFVRNLAYYRAGFCDDKTLFPDSEFWLTINSNFLEIAVVEWCKLFADGRARHDWKKAVVDPSAFLPQLLADRGLSLRDWALPEVDA